MPLPTPQDFLSSLFLTSSPTASSDSILPFNDPFTRSLLLTFHCLFPADLLPALDLLDRRLITRFILSPSEAKGIEKEWEEFGEGEEGGTRKMKKRAAAAAYYVRSSQNIHRSRARGDAWMAHHYEVRLRAWNCTCPAFIFSSFASLQDNDAVREGHNHHDEDNSVHTGGFFGGLMMSEVRDVPVCKHLLACLLVERGGGFEFFVEEREVGEDELAGWAAGWGDKIG